MISEARNQLALAALDPDAALAASPVVDAEPHAAPPSTTGPIVIAIEAPVPKRHQRWRWFIAYVLLRLAAKVYGFQIEFFRPPNPWEE